MRTYATSLIAVMLLASIAAGADDPQLQEVRQAAIGVLRNTQPKAMPEQGVKLKLTAAPTRDLSTWHFRTGVPFAFGALKAGEPLRLLQGDREIPVQTEVLATWGPADSEFGSAVKWLGVDFVDRVSAGEQTEYRLVKGKLTRSKLTVNETDHHITINNGRLNLVVNKTGGFNLFESVKLGGKAVVAPGQATGAYIVDGQGRTFLARHDATANVKVEMSGSVAAVIRAEGWFVNPKVRITTPPKEPGPRPEGGFCRFVTRIYVAADQPDVRVQHTFILTEDSDTTTYRDIGIALPISNSTSASYGGVKGEHDGHTYLLQESWDRFTVHRVTSDGSNVIAEGEKPEGWITAGNIAVGIRDFWQNFPKELEADTAAGQMRVHLWPDHGLPRKQTTQTLNDKNAWRLPFVHSGDELDFRIPEVLADSKSFPQLHGGGYIESMYKANAIGVAKTHDLLISFEPKHMSARMAAFNVDPHALADPQYTASTRIFGPIPAAEPGKRPLLEHRYNASVRFVRRSADLSGSFGMWNYGDLHTYLRIEGETVWPQYRRLWAATHYNYPRVAWWQYWRAGDHEVGLHARRESRHIMDVDICHWTNELFESREHQPVYHRRKAVGGLCDYKGVVHWHAGDRNAYNACIDFMLYDYYLTGNRRAWDVAMAHGRYIQKTGTKSIGRGAAGQADTLIELYKATWDPTVGERLVWHLNRILKIPPGNHDQKLDWTPWITRYWDLTHDPAIKDYLIGWLEDYGSARLNLWAYGYYITGKKDYATRVAQSLLQHEVTTIVGSAQFDGMIGRNMKPWADELTSAMPSLKAAESATLQLSDFQPVKHWPYWTNWGIRVPYTIYKKLIDDYFHGTFPWPQDDTFRITSYIYHDGSPKKLWLGVQSMSARPATNVELFAPDGGLIKHVQLEHFDRVIRVVSREGAVAVKKIWPARYNYPREGDKVTINGKTYDVERDQVILETRPCRSPEDVYALCSEAVTLTSNDPKGFYKVVHAGPFYTPVPILPPSGKVWLKVGTESTIEIGGFQYFYVPPDCEQFEMSFLPTYTKTRFKSKLRLASGAILNPDCKPVASISCGLATRPQVITITVPPAHRGKAWGITGQLFSIVSMKGVPPYISPSFDAVATPPHVPDIVTSNVSLEQH